MSYTPAYLLLPAKRLIDTVEVVAAGAGAGQLNAPITSFDFGAAGDGLRQAAIGGAGVVSYEAEIDIFTVLSSGIYTFRPNGLATDQEGIGLNASSSIVRFTLSDLLVAGALTGPATIRCVLKFTARDGQVRGYQAWFGQRRNGFTTASNLQCASWFGTWGASATPLSSLQIISSVADSIGAGTMASLYERRRKFA